ncbi:hypothetical protein TcWFU_005915 [Taenia crassiceps]|uniref:Uncharacterized protein n=1 Tax=Taenia crassiceps TaxID=6207 RepID=A0ABR4Q721_9CEST
MSAGTHSESSKLINICAAVTAVSTVSPTTTPTSSPRSSPVSRPPAIQFCHSLTPSGAFYTHVSSRRYTRVDKKYQQLRQLGPTPPSPPPPPPPPASWIHPQPYPP